MTGAAEGARAGRAPARGWLVLVVVAGLAAGPSLASGQTRAAGPPAAGVVQPAPQAPPASVDELSFEPQPFYVGDRVTARIVVRSDRQLTPPAAVAPGEWVVVHDVEVLPRSDGRWEVRIGFSSYQPGVLTLPAIDVGPFRLENIRAQATSLLAPAGAVPAVLQPPRRQMLLPGTRGALIGGVLALLVVPYLLVGGVLSLTRTARRWRAERACTLPRTRLERAVLRLQERAPQSSAAAAEAVSFYAQLSHLARDYLAARLQMPAHASTTRELRAALPALGLANGLGADLTAILETADRVKFAGRYSGAAEMQTVSQRLVILVQAIDADLERRSRMAAGAPHVER